MDQFETVTVALGAYQKLVLTAADLGEQYTNGGKEPRTLVAVLHTPIDTHFEMKSLTALLSEDAQRAIIEALQENLDRDKVEE